MTIEFQLRSKGVSDEAFNALCARFAPALKEAQDEHEKAWRRDRNLSDAVRAANEKIGAIHKAIFDECGVFPNGNGDIHRRASLSGGA